jgi:hypothetical protein
MVRSGSKDTGLRRIENPAGTIGIIGIANEKQDVLNDVDSEVLENVSSFVRSTSPET